VRIIGHGVRQSCLHLVWAEDHAPSDKAIESLIREAPTRPSDRSEERRPEWGHSDTKAAQRSLDKLRWGLIPYWAKDIKVGFANINAKAEGIERSRRSARRPRAGAVWCRSTVFMSGAKLRRGKQPYALALADRGLMELAGVWENWQSPAGKWMRSFAIITTTPNELCAEIHNRMPVILKPEAWPAWLGEKPAEVPQLKALLAALPVRGHDLLAGQRGRRQCQEQRFGWRS
jgi:putative SOS response-associated peptidase YedK